jgi:hypothetical protein
MRVANLLNFNTIESAWFAEKFNVFKAIAQLPKLSVEARFPGHSAGWAAMAV